MDDKIQLEKQDLTFLVWSKYRHSSGTAGSFLKSYSDFGETRKYYKLSSYDAVSGVFGHESINEIVADRLLTIFGIDHVPYSLVHADIIIDDNPVSTYVCVSDDFKKQGERKMAFDQYFQQWKNKRESPLEFCKRMGWQDSIDAMLVTDFLILNRDRHGANIEVLKDTNNSQTRLAPLYDHGVSLLFSCQNDKEMEAYDVTEDKPVQCFVGGRSSFENLKLISNNPVKNALTPQDKDILLFDLETVLPVEWLEKIWAMIWERWCIYEDLQDH